jgi:hypothetical protein
MNTPINTPEARTVIRMAVIKSIELARLANTQLQRVSPHPCSTYSIATAISDQMSFFVPNEGDSEAELSAKTLLLSLAHKAIDGIAYSMTLPSTRISPEEGKELSLKGIDAGEAWQKVAKLFPDPVQKIEDIVKGALKETLEKAGMDVTFVSGRGETPEEALDNAMRDAKEKLGTALRDIIRSN